MSIDDTSAFPVRIEEPASRCRESVFVADLAVEGPRLGRRPFERAICTLAGECTDAPLAHVEIPDDRTAFAVTVDGTRTQFELLYMDESLDRNELEIVWACRRAAVDRVVVATTGPVTSGTRVFQLNHDLELVRIDADRESETVIWSVK
jgi:hypothetical protein